MLASSLIRIAAPASLPDKLDCHQQSRSYVKIGNIECIVLNEFAARLDFIAH